MKIIKGFSCMNYFEKWQLKHEFLAAKRAARLRRYKANRQDHSTLTLAHERILSGKFEEKIKKQSVTLKNGQALDILTNQNLNHDTTILLHTNGENIRTLLRHGQLKPQALTSKAIKAIGKYNKKCADRKIKSRIESTLSYEKDVLVNMAQDRIEFLQDLEVFIGHRVHQPQVVFDQLLKVLERYRAQQDLYLNDAALKASYLGSDFPEAYREDILKAEQAAADDLKLLLEQNRNNAAWLETLGYEALHSFVADRSVAILRQTQALNQMLTHRPGSGAYLRGDLNSFIEDAVKLTRDAVQDLHNPITPAHQLAYPKDKVLMVDTDDHTDGSREELEEFLLIVSEVCGDNEPLEHKKLKGPITITPATKWMHFRSFYNGKNPYDKPWNFGYLAKVVLGWVLAPFNLLETMVRGNDAGFFASFYEPEENPKVAAKTDYYALIYRVQEYTSLSTKIGLTIHKIFSYLFWEGLVMGFYDGLKQLLRLPIDLFTDFHNQESTPDELLQKLRTELEDLQLEEDEVLKDLRAEEAAEEKPAEEKELDYARPEVPLTPYHSHGILNSGTDGFTNFVDLFGHNMFAKHPFTAAVSSLGAAASFMAFFATPTAVSIMGKGYVKFLQDLGYFWTRDTVAASLSGAFTNFKIFGAVLEGIEHGPDSWLSKGASIVVKDPATAISYATLSWMLGYAMVYQIEIPGLSEELREQMGTLPEPTEAFGGAKILILSKHLLSNPHESSKALRKDYVEDCVKLYKTMQKQNGVTVTKAEEAAFKASMESLVSPEKMRALQADLASKISKEEKDKLALMMMLATNKERLKHLSPVLKAKLEHQLPALTGSEADGSAVQKWLDPEHYHQQSTLRGFIGRILGYIPVLIRCALSPLALIWTWSLSSAFRPWKALGSMLLDDLTSTVHAALNFAHKVLETVFNRLLRTLADIVVNGIVARVASYFGYDGITTGGYELSAAWDIAQEKLCSSTTGKLMNTLARANTTPDPEIGLQNGVEARMTASFAKTAPPGFFEGNKSCNSNVIQPAVPMFTLKVV